MTNQQILERAIEKAWENGWLGSVTSEIDNFPEHWLFNHDFAKALWGEELIYGDGIGESWHMWEFELQQMVVADDPIKYLGENI